MAKTAWINRNERKRATVKKYAALRTELKAKKDYAGLAQLPRDARSEEHTSELQSPCNLVCRLLLEKKKKTHTNTPTTCPQPHAPPTHLPTPSRDAPQRFRRLSIISIASSIRSAYPRLISDVLQLAS